MLLGPGHGMVLQLVRWFESVPAAEETANMFYLVATILLLVAFPRSGAGIVLLGLYLV